MRQPTPKLMLTSTTCWWRGRPRRLRKGKRNMTKRIYPLSIMIRFRAAWHYGCCERTDGVMKPIPALEWTADPIGIPGVSAIAPVGAFLAGGQSRRNFAACTLAGQVLDPKRILVGSTSRIRRAASRSWSNGRLFSCRSIHWQHSARSSADVRGGGRGKRRRSEAWCKCSARRTPLF